MKLVTAACSHNILHFHCLFEGKMLLVHLNGDNHIQNIYLGNYIIGYMLKKSQFTAPLR